MIGFAILAAQLATSVRRAWRDRTFRSAVLTLATVVATATVFYCLHEGWSVLDSLYFSVATGLTLGYGDLVPTTPASKIFTMVYALSAVGLFVTVGGLLANAMAERTPARPRRGGGTGRRGRGSGTVEEP